MSGGRPSPLGERGSSAALTVGAVLTPGGPLEAPDHAIRRPVGERGSFLTVRLMGPRTQIRPSRARCPGLVAIPRDWRQTRGIRAWQRPAMPRLAPNAGNS